MKRRDPLLVIALMVCVALLNSALLASGTTNMTRSWPTLGAFPQTRDLESPRDRGLDNWSASPGLRQDAPEKPNFSGRWRLNRHASDDVAKIVGETFTRNTEVSTPLALRVRQAFAIRHTNLRKQLGRLLVQVLEAPESLLILHEDSSLTIVDPLGRERTLFVDVATNIHPAQDVIVTTKWYGMQLVTEVNLRNKGVARMIIALAPGGFQLHLTLRIQYVGLDPITIHNIYDFVAES